MKCNVEKCNREVDKRIAMCLKHLEETMDFERKQIEKKIFKEIEKLNEDILGDLLIYQTVYKALFKKLKKREK